MRLSIATKIFIAFTCVVVIFTGVLMYGVYRTQTLFNQIQRLNQQIVPLSLTLSDAQTDLKSFNVLLNERDPLVLRRTLQVTRLVRSLPDRFHEKIRRAHQRAQEGDLEKFSEETNIDTPPFEQRLSTLLAQSEQFAERAQEFTRLALRNDDPGRGDTLDPRVQTLQSELRDQARSINQSLKALRNDLGTTTDRALARANDNERSSLYALGALSGVALLVSLGLLLVAVHTVRPLTTLTSAAKRIGEGDYRPIDDEEIPQNRLGTDEITLLAQEFNSMARKLAERDAKLREQHQALLKSERLATIGRMTSLITHELRNPLSSINLNSEMLMEGLVERGIDPDDPEIMPLLETIIDEVDRLRDITEEYLVYARLPSPDLESENLVDIVHNLVDFHIGEWARQSVGVEVHPSDDEIDVQADANHLRQALLNIIKNAIEASPEESTVEVELKTYDDRAVITVTDEGPGIPDDVRDQIFEPFFTTKSNGTGLGLAMTQQIVEEHQGEIRIETPDEGGTRFIIEIPRG